MAAAPRAAPRIWPAYAVVVAAWLALWAPQIFKAQVLTLGDARVFRPFAEYSRERWLSVHQRTYWNPYVFCGISASASLADSRPQYLPDAALDLFEVLRPSRVVPLAGPLLAHLAGMLAMAALARALWGSGVAAIVFAGVAWGLMPELMVPFAFGHDAQLVACSLLPVVLLAIHHACTREARAACGATLGLSAVSAVMVLTGHPQIVVLGSMLALAFALERALSHGRPARLLWLGAAAALAVAMAAAVWLPALRYGAASFRGGGGALGVPTEEIERYSPGLRDLLAFASPWAVGFGGDTYWGGMERTDYPRFLGVVVLALAASTLARGLRNSTVAVLALAAAFAVLSSLGSTLGPLGAALRAVVPLSSRFRTATMWIVVAQLAIVLLAARAFAADPGFPPRPPRRAWIAAAALLLAGLALAGPLAPGLAALIRELRPQALAARAAQAAGLDLAARAAVLAATATLLWRMRARGPRSPRAAAGLVALATLDLASVTAPILRRSTGPYPSVLAAPAPELARLGAREPWVRVSSARHVPSRPGTRIGTRRDFEIYSNDWIRWRARSLGGTHGAPPALWREMSDITRSYGAMCAFGVAYMSSDPGPAWDERRFETVYRGAGEVVYHLRAALGRVYAVPEVVSLGNNVAVIRAMMTQDFDPAQVAFAAAPDAAGVYPGSAGCRIRWVADEPDRIVLETQAGDRAFVVLADAWFPGWSARVDGGEATIHRVNQLVRGVAVPGGTHRIEMTFVPEGWRTGLMLTRVGWLALAALAAAWGMWTILDRGARGGFA
ncbi:MAG TPA: YfhO family protein [Candidatus Eisenbacteria bacterium]